MNHSTAAKPYESFPARFKTPRAVEMGFKADTDIDAIIKAYIASEGIRL